MRSCDFKLSFQMKFPLIKSLPYIRNPNISVISNNFKIWLTNLLDQQRQPKSQSRFTVIQWFSKVNFKISWVLNATKWNHMVTSNARLENDGLPVQLQCRCRKIMLKSSNNHGSKTKRKIFHERWIQDEQLKTEKESAYLLLFFISNVWITLVPT